LQTKELLSNVQIYMLSYENYENLKKCYIHTKTINKIKLKN